MENEKIKKQMDELTSNAYKTATENIVIAVNRCIGREILTEKDWEKAENLSKKLGVMFYENGDIAL